MLRFLRRMYYNLQRVPPFLAACLSSNGLLHPEGRILILGKFRRLLLSFFPPIAKFLQKYFRLQGACNQCGASCKLLFQCPHWDDNSKLCTVYNDRPNICRLFPITPADIRDRDLVSKRIPCGFSFKPLPARNTRISKKPTPLGIPGPYLK